MRKPKLHFWTAVESSILYLVYLDGRIYVNSNQTQEDHAENSAPMSSARTSVRSCAAALHTGTSQKSSISVSESELIDEGTTWSVE